MPTPPPPQDLEIAKLLNERKMHLGHGTSDDISQLCNQLLDAFDVRAKADNHTGDLWSQSEGSQPPEEGPAVPPTPPESTDPCTGDARGDLRCFHCVNCIKRGTRTTTVNSSAGIT